MLDVKTVFDRLETRCPRLGGTAPFDYCRKVANGLPCSKSLLCWEMMFPVREYMAKVLTEEEWRTVFEQPPKPRLEVILEAAEKAAGRRE